MRLRLPLDCGTMSVFVYAMYMGAPLQTIETIEGGRAAKVGRQAMLVLLGDSA